jgi:hypothetical protein
VRGLGFELRDPENVHAETLRRIQLCQSMLPLGMTDTLRGQPFNCWHLRLALDAGHATHIVRALVPEIAFRATAGAPAIDDVDALIATASRLAGESGDPYLVGLVEGTSGLAAYCTSSSASAPSSPRKKVPRMP